MDDLKYYIYDDISEKYLKITGTGEYKDATDIPNKYAAKAMLWLLKRVYGSQLRIKTIWFPMTDEAKKNMENSACSHTMDENGK